jgi:hypothetical protein
VVIHVIATVVYASGPVSMFDLGALSWSLLPYGTLFMLGRKFGPAFSILCGAVIMLLVDLNALWSVYIRPGNSTAGLNLLAAPLFHFCILLPIVTAAAFFERRRSH